MDRVGKTRLLVFVVAYNAEKTIAQVVSRVPVSLLETYDVDVLILDDSSGDATFERGHHVSKDAGSPFRVTILYNPVNQGYGGNQKLGYSYAIGNGYDFVALIHGDGQYAPECLPALLEPLRSGAADAVFGSRLLTPGGARRGGMPFYKLVGNRVLTWIENKLLHSSLSEFHSGYRIYSTQALRAIPFTRNSNDFHFDTEIIIQLLIAKLRIRELPIPTYYGDEVCHVNGPKYALNVIAAAAKARFQKLGLLYDRKFDCAPQAEPPNPAEASYPNPMSLAVARVRANSRVLVLGAAGGPAARILANQKGCLVDYADNLDRGLPRFDFRRYDYVLLPDAIEHLSNPEQFLDELKVALGTNPSAEVIVTAANVGFIVPRLMLLAGQFNYTRRGILDMTHTRLFTFGSFERTLQQAGFDIIEALGIPGAFPLALGENRLARTMMAANSLMIRLSRGLFSYQMLLRIKPRPSIEFLLRTARERSKMRAAELESELRR